MTLINNHQTIAKERQCFEMLRPGYGLDRGDGNGRPPFMATCAHLADDSQRIDQTELVGSLLEQLLPMGDNQSVQAEPASDFYKDQGFATAGGQYQECLSPLRSLLIGGYYPLDACHLIGAQGKLWGRRGGIHHQHARLFSLSNANAPHAILHMRGW